MHRAESPRLSAFESRWLAEAVRLREERDGALADREAVAEVRAVRGDVEARILRRALRLGERAGLASAIASWMSHARLVAMLLAVIALASGFGAAVAVLGDGTRPVNVVWALGGLLGVHLLSLALWAVGLGFDGREAGGVLGRGWLWLSSKVGGGRDVADVGHALVGLVGPPRLTRWWLGAMTHGFWLAALVGAVAGLLVTLSARRYGFVWETTILPVDVFVAFVERVGWLPAQLGFAVPDAETVRASGERAADAEPMRRAWSSWLVGCVVVYGVLPRGLLWALCFGLWRAGRARLRLDLSLPAYAVLAQRLAPASERIGVTDADPGRIGSSPVRGRHAVANGGAVLVGLELGGRADWPPPLPPGVDDAGVLDTREDRKRVLDALATRPPARLLVACDARQTPDRGSLELIAELSRDPGECRVLLLGADSGEAGERRRHWHDGLAAIGMTPERVAVEPDAAVRWLREGGDAQGG